MKATLLLITTVALVVGCGKKPLIADPIEEAIREELKKPTGELTKADLEKVKVLILNSNQLTDVKGLEKLTQLIGLALENNPTSPRHRLMNCRRHCRSAIS
jgi:Leucine-rich repeat (LRR) protein